MDASGNRNLGNIANGVHIVSGSGDAIGGNVATAGNAIAFNGGNAVVVDTGTGNAVLSNSIHDNSGGGIVLINGGNNDQVAPALSDALLYSNRIVVDGSLAVEAGTSYIVQYFGNNPASGQGQTLLGGQAISTQPANGTVTLSFTASPSLPAGSTITAVASVTGTPPDSTDPALGDTSAFSTAAVLVNPFVVTNTNDSGIGSLRQAILYANANPGLDTITFDTRAQGCTSSARVPLSDLVDPVVIDATTQPGFAPSNPRPVIELNGADAGTGTSGFTIDTGGSTIKGLVINQFGGHGIVIDADYNLITGDWIGTDSTGNGTLANLSAGIGVYGTNNTIGGTGSESGNVISGNADEGIFVAVGGNLVQGNLIGTNANGTAALGNGLDGIFLSNSAGNTISGNLISGNGSHGINLSTASSNLVEGNKIGVNAGGMGAIGNVLDGIFLSNSAGNTISETSSRAMGSIRMPPGSTSSPTTATTSSPATRSAPTPPAMPCVGQLPARHLPRQRFQQQHDRRYRRTTIGNVISGNGTVPRRQFVHPGRRGGLHLRCEHVGQRRAGQLHRHQRRRHRRC